MSLGSQAAAGVTAGLGSELLFTQVQPATLALARFGPGLEILSANDEFAELFALDRSEMMGKT